MPKTEPDPDLSAAADRPTSRDVDGGFGSVADVSALERERLTRLAYRVMWYRGEAEDAVQDALLAAFKKAHQLRDREKRWSWLCRIVIQTCYEHGRQTSRRTKHEDAYSNSRQQSRDPGDEPQQSELKELVRRAIPKLSPRQQQVLILKDLEGMDYAEVGDILQISPSTARVHAKDAREALRELILRKHPEVFRAERSG